MEQQYTSHTQVRCRYNDPVSSRRSVSLPIVPTCFALRSMSLFLSMPSSTCLHNMLTSTPSSRLRFYTQIIHIYTLILTTNTRTPQPATCLIYLPHTHLLSLLNPRLEISPTPYRAIRRTFTTLVKHLHLLTIDDTITLILLPSRILPTQMTNTILVLSSILSLNLSPSPKSNLLHITLMLNRPLGLGLRRAMGGGGGGMVGGKGSIRMEGMVLRIGIKPRYSVVVIIFHRILILVLVLETLDGYLPLDRQLKVKVKPSHNIKPKFMDPDVPTIRKRAMWRITWCDGTSLLVLILIPIAIAIRRMRRRRERMGWERDGLGRESLSF